MKEEYRYVFELQELANKYPPRFADANKQAFHNKVAGGAPTTGRVEVTRWAAAQIPNQRGPHRPRVTVRSGFFTYDIPDTVTTRHWYLNFAHHDLFAFWSGPLLAQDEM